MTTAIVETKSLQERITERLHASIGELITDADLKQIVERGIEDFFFKAREAKTETTWGRSETIKLPPLVTELCDRYVKERMEVAVNAWLEAHQQEIQAAMEQAITKGAGAAMLSVLDMKFAAMFAGAVATMQSQGLLPKPPGY